MDARTLSRFSRKVTTTEGGCWNWAASLDVDGYGWFRDGKVKRAHRVAFEHHHGPIPEAMTVDHICRNHACVNPAHLRLLTRAENVLAGVGPVAVNARKTKCIRGHVFDAENTYITPQGWRMCRTCRSESQRRYDARCRAAAGS